MEETMVSATASGPSWETGWEVEFPGSSPTELLLALTVRDLLHGTSFDVEAAPDQPELAVDYLAGDELEAESYRLLVTVEAVGPEDRAMVQEITEQLLEQLVDEAEALVEQRELLATEAAEALRFDAVPEDEERWDLVVPDWLAPDGAEVPYGFRPVLQDGGAPWPTNADLDRHGRIVVVPFGDDVHQFAIPAPVVEDDEPLPDELPIVP
jgi:hypothetical protein